MGNFFVNWFKNGKWIDRGNSMLFNKSKMARLMAVLPKYLKKGGLEECKEDLVLLGEYVKDVSRGNYKQYSVATLSLAVGALLYVVSPLDVIPDIFPAAGFLDDVAIVGYALAQLQEELLRYKGTKEVTDSEAATPDSSATATTAKRCPNPVQ